VRVRGLSQVEQLAANLRPVLPLGGLPRSLSQRCVPSDVLVRRVDVPQCPRAGERVVDLAGCQVGVPAGVLPPRLVRVDDTIRRLPVLVAVASERLGLRVAAAAGPFDGFLGAVTSGLGGVYLFGEAPFRRGVGFGVAAPLGLGEVGLGGA